MLDPVLLRHQPAELAERLRATRGFVLDVSRLEALGKAYYIKRDLQAYLPSVQACAPVL